MIKKQFSEAAVKNDSAVTTPSPHIKDSLNNAQISESQTSGKLLEKIFLKFLWVTPLLPELWTETQALKTSFNIANLFFLSYLYNSNNILKT